MVAIRVTMELGINVLSVKWKFQILWTIYTKKVVRFNELQSMLGKITTQTLTDQLKELESQKIIDRKAYPEIPPKVEYLLSSIGETIEPVLKSLCDWENNYLNLLGNEIELILNTYNI